jgi:hypothetical protein
VIELFAVPPAEDERFLAAWAADHTRGHTLHRALRDDARHRYVSVPDGPASGVLLVTAAGDFSALAGRQGFISARVFGELAAVHWSSPLMYQRAVQAEGDLMPRSALYA